MAKKRNKNINKMLLASISFLILVILMVFYDFGINITGLAVSRPMDVYINDSLDGKLTAFDYNRTLDLGDIQNITVEFTNTGTVLYNTTIREIVYLYQDQRLNTSATYYDYQVPLYPGDRRHFKTYFKPQTFGTYYIKVLISYGPRRLETWGVFTVSAVGEGDGEGNVTPGPAVPVGGAISPIIRFASRNLTGVELEYPPVIDLYKGQRVVIGVKVKNIGNVSITNLGAYVSRPQTIEIDVDPKLIRELGGRESTMFIFSIYALPQAETGIHLVTFDIIGDAVKETGLLQLNVTEVKISREREIINRILNNRYLIVELEGQTLVASRKGINTTLSDIALGEARNHLQAADEYLNLADLDKAIEELDKKDDKIREAVFELAHEQFRVYVPPAFSPFWLLFLAILLGLFFLFIMRRKRKKKRPRLLRRSEESEA